MKITFLGTACMMPTKDRNATGILLQHEGENILIDCGEGTQRQLRKIRAPPTKITKILITHWHADHVLGIPGLFQTIAASCQEKEIELIGPKGSKKALSDVLKPFKYSSNLKVKVTEYKKPLQYEKFKIEALKLDHTATCLGYSIIENDKRKINLAYIKKFGLTQHKILGDLQKGKTIKYEGKTIRPENATTLIKGRKLSILLDTKVCNNATKIAKDADLLICESTHADQEKAHAEEFKHLTSKQAAQIAKKAKAKQLILTHFSQRYADITLLEKEAKKIFKNTKAVKDLDVISL